MLQGIRSFSRHLNLNTKQPATSSLFISIGMCNTLWLLIKLSLYSLLAALRSHNYHPCTTDATSPNVTTFGDKYSTSEDYSELECFSIISVDQLILEYLVISSFIYCSLTFYCDYALQSIASFPLSTHFFLNFTHYT